MNKRLLTSFAALAVTIGAGVAVAQAGDSGWTPYFSEETGPQYCESHERVGATHCTGSYCDNVSLYCKDTLPLHTGEDHTTWFSDEDWTGTDCTDQWYGLPNSEITAMACTGQYCDNMYIRCSRRESGAHSNCSWTPWVSEEGAGLNSFTDKHPRGAQCAGSYCDSMRFWVCDVS
jgi:hypothetical protein